MFENGFPEYIPAFIEEEIERAHFEDLNESDFDQLGFTIGDKIRFKKVFMPEKQYQQSPYQYQSQAPYNPPIHSQPPLTIQQRINQQTGLNLRMPFQKKMTGLYHILFIFINGNYTVLSVIKNDPFHITQYICVSLILVI